LITRIREDIQAALRQDPAARNWLEVILTYPGVHAGDIKVGEGAKISANMVVTKEVPAKTMVDSSEFFAI